MQSSSQQPEQQQPNNTNRIKKFTEAQESANVIKFQPNGEPYEQSPESARAPVYQKLMDMFGVVNGFTDFHVDVRSQQKKLAIQKMKRAIKLGTEEGEDWSDICKFAREAVEEYIDFNKKNLKVIEFVQYVTLRVSLQYLFGGAAANLKSVVRYQEITYITSQLERMWVAAERDDDLHSQDGDPRQPLWNVQHHLHMALDRVVNHPPLKMPGAWPDVEHELDRFDPKDPLTNPMNLLIPAYDTMWRIVLHCFVELKFRDNPVSHEWAGVLEKYVKELWERKEESHQHPFYKATTNNIRPVDVVKESLRLYPPVPFVHRVYHLDVHEANIEKCHRTELLGGQDPLFYRPDRWQNICPELRERIYRTDVAQGSTAALEEAEQKLCFMPFGFWCPADLQETSQFGMKLIGVLVGALCEGVALSWRVLGGAEKYAFPPHLGTPLSARRGSYMDVRIEKYAVAEDMNEDERRRALARSDDADNAINHENQEN